MSKKLDQRRLLARTRSLESMSVALGGSVGLCRLLELEATTTAAEQDRILTALSDVRARLDAALAAYTISQQAGA